MPSDVGLNQVPPLSFLTCKIITERRANANDAAFVKDVITNSNCPEYMVTTPDGVANQGCCLCQREM